jgi:hypothetical protein
MVIRSRENLIGAWAFFIGIIIAIIVGLVSNLTGKTIDPFTLTILVVLGLVVGYFVAEENVQSFLLASVSVVLVCFAGLQGLVLRAAIGGLDISQVMTAILGSLLFLFIPASIIVAIKTVFSLANG